MNCPVMRSGVRPLNLDVTDALLPAFEQVDPA
jgi:hypothetical protein